MAQLMIFCIGEVEVDVAVRTGEGVGVAVAVCAGRGAAKTDGVFLPEGNIRAKSTKSETRRAIFNVLLSWKNMS